MLKKPRKIAIIGGGISGLAAAHRITELNPDVQIRLWEKSSRLGGVLSTRHENGYQVEESADNFITTVPWGLDLCKRLGLSDQLVQTHPASRQTFVVHRGRLHKLPDGFLMMAPTRMWPLAVTPLLSPWGKLRAGLEFFIPPRRDMEDESMYNFGCRRMGRQVFERLIEPLMSGVYGADMKKLSLLATMPRFRDMEREHGSMIRAMRSQMLQRRRAERKKKADSKSPDEKSGKLTPGDTGARYSMFVTLRNGLTSMVDEIANRLPDGAVCTGRGAAKLERLDADSPNGDSADSANWRLTGDDGHSETFDAIILATPSGTAAELLKQVDQPLCQQLAGQVGTIEHTGTAIVTVAFKRKQVRHKLDGAGFVVPAVEDTPILAGSFSSVKYPHRVPEGSDDVLIRIFAGGSRAPEMCTMDDDRLVPTLLESLRPLLGIEGDPIYKTVAHWPGTMPQYHVGHLDLIKEIEQQVMHLPGLRLAGNAYHGVGVPACIHSGESAVEQLLG